MIEIKKIDAAHKADINIPNQPFSLFGRMLPCCRNRQWTYDVERFEEVFEMCFPDENYDYEAMSENTVFLGAYDGEACIGLAIVQQAFFRYMYLYDLKVDQAYRRKGVGARLIEQAIHIAKDAGYRGIYTIGQDNNLGACLFYLKNGFRIGGYDTEVYQGTNQAGKADVLFYLDC